VGSFSGRSQKTAIESEILFVSPELPSKALKHLFDDLASSRNVRWFQAPGRGRQTGVKATYKPYLWLLPILGLLNLR